VLALLLFNLAIGRIILRPLRQLERAMDGVTRDNYDKASLPTVHSGEIGRLVSHFHQMALSVLESRHSLELKIAQRTEALEQLSKTDPLTELLNRRGMTECMQAQIMRSQRDNQPFGIIWLDLDHFKGINDTYGHRIGDEALIHIARLIREQIRAYDSTARWGGDEFLILLQGGDLELLQSLSQRLCDCVAKTSLIAACGTAIRLNISAGAYLGTPQDDLETLLRRADLALYEAKHAGRNTVRTYSLSSSTPPRTEDSRY
jgi:diguanylate cyclase (GGDEF)-like protein